MLKHSLLITVITLLVLSTHFDAFTEAKCHRSRRRHNNCCCECKEEEEGTTTPQNNILSSVSGPSSPSTVSTSAIPVQSSSTAGPSSIVSTSKGEATTQSYKVQTTTATLKATTTPNPLGTCVQFSEGASVDADGVEINGAPPLSEECKQILKRPCDPNCKPPYPEQYFETECNPALSFVIPSNPEFTYSANLNLRCTKMCSAVGLYSCDGGCINRCNKYCHFPNNTTDTPVRLFCD